MKARHRSPRIAHRLPVAMAALTTALVSSASQAAFWPWDARSTPVPPPYGWVQPVPPPGYTATDAFEHDPLYSSPRDRYSYLGAIYPELRGKHEVGHE